MGSCWREVLSNVKLRNSILLWCIHTYIFFLGPYVYRNGTLRIGAHFQKPKLKIPKRKLGENRKSSNDRCAMQI